MPSKKAPDMFVFPLEGKEKQFKEAYENFLKVVGKYKDDPNFTSIPFVMDSSDQYMTCIKQYFDSDEAELYKLQTKLNAMYDITQEAKRHPSVTKEQAKKLDLEYRLRSKLIRKEIDALNEKIAEKQKKTEEQIKKDIESTKLATSTDLPKSEEVTQTVEDNNTTAKISEDNI